MRFKHKPHVGGLLSPAFYMYLCKSHSWQYFPLSFLRTDISDPLEGTDWSLEGLQLLLRSQQYGLEPASLLDVSVRPSLHWGGRGKEL